MLLRALQQPDSMLFTLDPECALDAASCSLHACCLTCCSYPEQYAVRPCKASSTAVTCILKRRLEVSPLFDGPLASQDAKGVICELSQHWHRGGDWRMIAVRESNPGCSGCGSTGSAGCRQTAAEQQVSCTRFSP